jgi:hypothetical protein
VRGRTRRAKVRHSLPVKRTPTEGREESCEGRNTRSKVRHSRTGKRTPTEGREESCEGPNTMGKVRHSHSVKTCKRLIINSKESETHVL